MVVGDKHAHAERVRVRDALERGDAVVDGDEHAGLARRRLVHDLRRDAVAVLGAVRDDVVDERAHGPQRLHRHGARGRAVGVVVGDDEELLAPRDRIGEENRGLTHVR